MSAVAQRPPGRWAAGRVATPRIALLGTGGVGGAFVARCEQLRAAGRAVPGFAWMGNSRALAARADDPVAALATLRAAPPRADAWAPWTEAAGLERGDVLVDATSSDAVAGWHAEWLARGVHVVTANKLGTGAALARCHAIAAAAAASGAGYGDAATVGAGLPLLRSIRALVAGGDRIRGIDGVLSGSLAWLFGGYDGARPFSALVREASRQGYAEPDPRTDLSGEDVRRKLLILARAAGWPLEAGQVRVESLLGSALGAAGAGEVDGLLPTLDDALEQRRRKAAAAGARLRFVGRVDAGGGRAGIEALPAHHRLSAGGGTDNVVAITSCRYQASPLLVRGPGAGAAVTAAALLDDVLALVSTR